MQYLLAHQIIQASSSRGFKTERDVLEGEFHKGE
jgi:hypothetical protein